MLKRGDLVRIKKSNTVGIFLKNYKTELDPHDPNPERVVLYNNEEWVFFDFEVEKLEADDVQSK